MASIVVGVTGGVAAFKAPIVVRECQRAGHDVYVAATRASLEFVGRSTWEGITSRPVAVEIAGEGRAEHVELARVADLIIIVPATANTLARLAGGFADDMVSLTVLASDAPVVVAPAMHSNMSACPRHPSERGDAARSRCPRHRSRLRCPRVRGQRYRSSPRTRGDRTPSPGGARTSRKRLTPLPSWRAGPSW